MINTQNNFPESRYRHCHNVGLKMYSYAKYHLGMDDVQCQSMFLLGTFHDVGYELDADAFKHDVAMCDALGHDGYKYAKEIKYHSFMQDAYDSIEMKLLYFGDMTVDGMGNWCTLDERLQDLEKRHGLESDVYIESKRIADKLIEWGFDDSLNPEEYIANISARPSTVAVKEPPKGFMKLKSMSDAIDAADNGKIDRSVIYTG